MRELRDDRHAEGAANAVVVKEFVPFKVVDAGRAKHRKQIDRKSSRAAMHGWKRKRKMTERERERGGSFGLG